MKQENLEKMLEATIEAIDKLDINLIDKTEFMINLNTFIMNYEMNIRTLQESNERRKGLR